MTPNLPRKLPNWIKTGLQSPGTSATHDECLDE